MEEQNVVRWEIKAYREKEKDGGVIDMPAATLWNQDVR